MKISVFLCLLVLVELSWAHKSWRKKWSGRWRWNRRTTRQNNHPTTTTQPPTPGSYDSCYRFSGWNSAYRVFFERILSVGEQSETCPRSYFRTCRRKIGCRKGCKKNINKCRQNDRYYLWKRLFEATGQKCFEDLMNKNEKYKCQDVAECVRRCKSRVFRRDYRRCQYNKNWCCEYGWRRPCKEGDEYLKTNEICDAPTTPSPC